MSNSVELNKTNPINYNSIVFGGSGHLGHSICQTLKQHGSDVVTTYFKGKNKHNLEKLKDNDISCLLCDITNNNSVNDVIKQTKNKFPSINSMVYAIGSFNNLTKQTANGEEFLSIADIKKRIPR